MGVEGLKHYVLWHRKCCLHDAHLHDCRVLIDGSNLAYLLYNRAPGVLPAYGGDYDKYAAYITFFFNRLRACNIEATVIMDGGQPRHNIKLHTCTTRLQNTLETCLDSVPLPPHSRVFPLHARSVFTHVLRRLGVPVLQSDAEADRDLAFLAPHFSASVISNDSDFFLYGVKFIPLDYLRFTCLKQGLDKDGSRKYMIPCKVFQQDKFLQLSNLKRRHLGLLGALSGNDCVPASLLARFHRRVVEGSNRRKTHTHRQHVIRYVLLFLKHHRNVETTALIDKACNMAEGDNKLRELLLHVTDSYRPRSSPLSYWMQRLYPLSTSLSCAAEPSMTPAALCSIHISSDLAQDAGASAQVDACTNSSTGEGDLQLCTCERPWAHAYDSSPVGSRISCDCNDFSSLFDEEETTDIPSDSERGPDDLPEDEPEDTPSIGSTSADDLAPTDAVIELDDTSSLGKEKCDVQDDSLNADTDSTTFEVHQVLNKKGRKNELQDIRLLRKMRKKLSKKNVFPDKNGEAHKGPKEKFFDHTGMNSEQILRELEKASKEDKIEDDTESIDSDFLPLINHESEYFIDESFGVEGSLPQLSQCGHAVSSLVTDSGFRLPGWLVYGYRHIFVTREISDIVTNSFCISPPQVEHVQSPTSYKCVEPVWKMIVAMVRGGGNDGQVDIKNGISLSHSDTLAPTTTTLNSKANKRKSRKDPNTIRWFIRKRKNLHIENVALDSLLLELGHSTPSLQSIELMSVEERKRMYLHLALGVVPDDFLGLPDEIALVLSFVCYWYKSSVSNVTENHLLSVVFTFFVFYFVYGNVKRVTHKGLRVFCLHCCLANYCSALDNKKLKFIIDNLECLKTDFNWGCESEVSSSHKPPAHWTKLGEAFSNSPDCPTVSDLLSRIDHREWTAVSKAVSTLHSPPSMTVTAYNRRFVHSMSEYQACVHYLNILNGLFIVPFNPVGMDRIWSGTFCYGVYANLCHLTDGGVNLIALLLGQNSPSMHLFAMLYKAVLEVLGLQFPVPNLDASPETAAERALKAMFRKKTSGVAEHKKQPESRKTGHERKKARAGVQVLNDVPV
ncbi:PIN domain-like [Trinorchestia longiramus]|nr:PIN domain-like [Trinorchestia longiramus]